MKNKSLFLFLLTLITFGYLSTAMAVDIPHLYWERGHQQTITLGGNISSELYSLELMKDGKAIGSFAKSSTNKRGFVVYSLDLASDMKLGNYEISSSSANKFANIVATVSIMAATSYDPVGDPKTIGIISVVLFSVLSLFSGVISDTDGDSLGAIDNEDIEHESHEEGWIDRRRIGRRRINRWADEIRLLGIMKVSAWSKLGKRIAIDSTYLQALSGIFVLIPSFFSAIIGTLLAAKYSSPLSVLPTSWILTSLLVVFGILDSFAGVVGWFCYAFFTISAGHLHGVVGIRTLMSFALLCFTPILIAGATRSLRRARSKNYFLERAVDICFSALVVAWASRGMISAVEGFARQHTILGMHAYAASYLISCAVVLRYLLEDAALRLSPRRLNYLSPKKVPHQVFDGFAFAILGKIIIFLFFMFGFFGVTWQVFVALSMIVIPTILKRFSEHFPNSPRIYHAIPSGIPGLVVMTLIGFLLAQWVEKLPILTPDRSKTIFILVGVPSLVLSLLKLFGRHPVDGDHKWYLRPQNKKLYHGLGTIMVVLGIFITVGVLP